MKINKAIQVMKILVLIAGLCLLFSFFKYDTNDCQACSFDLEGKSVGIERFIGKYFEVCVEKIEENPFGGD